MDSEKVRQENLCLQTKILIDKLRTNLFEIYEFRDFDRWEKQLKKLKSVVNNIYWDL